MELFQVKNRVFDTYPSIFHHPGKIGDGNNIIGIVQLKKIFFELVGKSNNNFFLDEKENLRLRIPAPSNFGMSTVAEKLTVIFVSNLDEPGSGPRSCDYFGVPYRILGRQVTQWSNSLKLKFLHEELSNIKTKYFLLLDSNDTFIINDLSNTVKILETSFDCDILLNAGQNLWPSRAPKMDIYGAFCDQVGEAVKSNHRYVNTGALIANTNFYKEIVKDIDLENAPLRGSDQSAFYPLYKQYYPKIQLDYHCKIFQCEFDEELSLESGVVPWYKRKIFHSNSIFNPLLKKYAVWRRTRQRIT